MLSDVSLLLLLLLGVGINSKPIDKLSSDKNFNEVETGTESDYKRIRDEVYVTIFPEVPRPSSSSLIEETASNSERISPSTATSTITAGGDDDTASEKFLQADSLENSTAGSGSTRQQQGFAWFLTPFTQKIQFSPETIFREKIGQLKDTFGHIGSIFSNQEELGGKQFGNGGLVNLVGLNDSGFYTNRLEPVGFFGGNGWFANKGGILGGPGAFVSTGSILTDYQTPYRK